ncbi:MAG: bacillithiol biosynthesis cysteine-adding enzyme BshC [candidate division Zixibacteria bacterium]
MKDAIVKYSELSGYSDLFLDFNYNREKLSGIFGASRHNLKIEQISKSSYPKRELANILMRQNKGWNAPERVLENISKLTDEKSVVVTAGQQACLFGGPYLVLLKILTVLKKAKLLEKELEIPVIPLFWIASDDHDFAEISRAHIFDSRGEIVRLAIDYDKERKYPPVGTMSFDDTVTREVNKFMSHFPENDYKEMAVNSIEKYYSSGVSIVDAFARYWLNLLGQYGIVMLNPHDAEFKKLCAPFMTSVVDKHEEMKRVLNESNEWLTSQSYHLQVQKPESSMHLFAHFPERIAIHQRDDEFFARDKKYSQESLKEDIKANLLNFSPDVFTRSLLQSYLFPVLDIIAGPSEIAYLAQIMPLFDLFELPRPDITARLSATLIENKFEKLMTSLNLQYQDVVLDFEEILRTRQNEDFPDSIKLQINSIRQSNIEKMRELREISNRYDFDSKNIVEKYQRKMDYLTGELEKRLESAYINQSGSVKSKLERMRKALMPVNNPSERSIALVYFISRYGMNVIDFIDENLNLDSAGHQLIYLSEYHG